MTHPHPKGNFVPKAVLMKSGIEILNTVGQNFSKAAVSVNIARPINSAYPRPTVNSARIASNVFNRAHTHGNVTTAGPKAVVSDNKINEANVVKTSACWVWRPKQKILDHVSRHNGASMNFKRFDYVDAQCRSKHMTRNKSYLSDYEEIDGGFIAFGGDPKGGRTTGKDKISTGRKPALSFMRPIGCPVTILNILDHLGEFDGKADEGFFVGYSTNSKAYRVFNSRTRIVEENLSKDSPNAGFKPSGEEEKIDSEHQENEDSEVPNTEEPRINQEQDANVNSTNNINTVSPTVNAADIENNAVDENIVYRCIDDPNMPNLEEIVYSDDDEEVGAEADMNNLATTMLVSPIPTTRVHKDHPLEQIIGDIQSAPQTRRMTKNVTEHVEPKKVIQALTDPSWIEAMQDELLQFKLQKMDVKSAFLYGTIEEEVYFCQPPGFEDPEFSNKVYKVKQKDDGIFISQDKYVADILKKFDFATVRTASTPIDTNKALLKDEEAADVDVHLYRLMIGSLMYLTASRPDITFAVCTCARFQVTPKVSHLHAVKRIFRYLKGQPKLGLWYLRDSPFDLEAFFDSDYASASLDKKSTTGAEYVAAANCRGQVLWIQNQFLDYGYNFINTKIFIDNESTICIVKNIVFHSKTKHIEIRHHFIRDLYEKRLIQVIKIHTDHNVVDLLTKAFDVSRFQYLIASIGMLNL
ncbi:putative ribonuclease H-like domain-containing protein [Tanacetum coccineum]